MHATSNGTWTWWHQDHGIVVGWLRPEQFGDDLPLMSVASARDAQLVVGVLSTLDARPVAL